VDKDGLVKRRRSLVGTIGTLLSIRLMTSASFQITHGDKRGLLGNHSIVSSRKLVASVPNTTHVQLERLRVLHLNLTTVYHALRESRGRERCCQCCGRNYRLSQKLVKLRGQAHRVVVVAAIATITNSIGAPVSILLATLGLTVLGHL